MREHIVLWVSTCIYKCLLLFKNILTSDLVVHRLNTIMESDDILVLKDGSMAEYDHPGFLVEKEEGIFSSMVQQVKFTLRFGITDWQVGNICSFPFVSYSTLELMFQDKQHVMSTYTQHVVRASFQAYMHAFAEDQL